MKTHFITVTIVLLFSAYALAGGVAGGGGTFCQNASVNHGHPILLDLALSPKPIFDPPVASEKISETITSERLGIDEFPPSLLNKIKKDINARLSFWEKGSPKAIRLIRSALAAVQFRITPFWYSHVYRAYVPSSSVCQSASLEGAVFYYDGEAVVSIPLWNSAGKLSHRGLILHEALRHIQLFNRFPINDAQLQSLTLKIMKANPTKGESLDVLPFFNIYKKQGSDVRLRISEMCDDYVHLNRRSQERQVFNNSPQFEETMGFVCGSESPNLLSLTQPLQKAYNSIENLEPYNLEAAETSRDVTLTQNFLQDARASYFSELLYLMSPSTPYFENAKNLATYVQVNAGLRYIKDFLTGNLKLSQRSSEAMSRYIALEHDKFKAALEGSQKKSLRHSIDWSQFRADTKTEAQSAAIETDLYFACSESGSKESRSFVAAMNNGMPFASDGHEVQVEDKMIASYERVYDCKQNIKKALVAGLTKTQILEAVER